MPGITRDDGLSRRRTVTCTTVADLIIRANENVHNAEENRKLRYVTEFRALRERLMSRSTFFMAELPRKHPKQTPPTFALEGDNSSISIELWFAIPHCEDNVVGVGAKFDLLPKSRGSQTLARKVV